MKVSTQLDVQLQTLDTGSKVTVTALLDSGVMSGFEYMVLQTLNYSYIYSANQMSSQA